MRYCELGSQGDNGLAREYGVSFISRTVTFWSWPIVLNQHEVFLDITTGHIHTEIFWDNVNSKINIRVIFREGAYVQLFFWAMTSTRITLRFSILTLYQHNEKLLKNADPISELLHTYAPIFGLQWLFHNLPSTASVLGDFPWPHKRSHGGHFFHTVHLSK